MNGSKVKMLRRLARAVSPKGVPHAVGGQGNRGYFELSSACTKKIGKRMKRNSLHQRPWRHLESRGIPEQGTSQ